MSLLSHTEQFESHRPRLLRLAYQMTGLMAEAQDVVQETYLRWDAADRESIGSPGAWLRQVASRLCLDIQKSARVVRTDYVGPWLPEPVLTDVDASPFDAVELADSVSIALMQVLERLGPAERVAFILREAFGYAYSEIAQVLQKEEPACRQLVLRARKRVRSERPRFPTSRQEHLNVLQEFIAASETGRVEPLLDVLAEEATLWSDGGGRVLAATKPILGADRIARFLVGVSKMQPEGQTHALREINGTTGIVGYTGGRPRFTMTFDIRGGRIVGIHVVMNPEKLTAVRRLE